MNNDHANFRDENNIQTNLTIENEKSKKVLPKEKGITNYTHQIGRAHV